MAKGADFERTICKQLSLWWTQDDRVPSDDVYWRSSNSGGRATVRGRKGKNTHGQYGDVAATNPIGAPLLDFCALELKRGYSKADFHALFDRPKKSAQQVWEAWIQQAVASYNGSGSYSWMIVARRNNRDTMVVMDYAIVDALRPCFRQLRKEVFLTATAQIRYKSPNKEVTHKFSAMRWDAWLSVVTPKDIREALRKV